MTTPSLQELLEAGLHFGHQVKRWHPAMAPYIYGKRENIHIIDLTKTKTALEEAAEFVKEATAEGKMIMFIGTKRQAQDIIRSEAERAGVPYMDKRWVGGLITNWEQMKKNIDKLNKYEADKATGNLSQYTKKEQLLMARQMHKLKQELGGIQHITRIPDVLFIIDPKKEINAILEANRKGIQTVALCDTNTNPQQVNYPIPGNDDSIKSLGLVTKTIADAVIEGKAAFDKAGVKKASTAAETATVVEEPVVVNVAEVIEAVAAEVEVEEGEKPMIEAEVETIDEAPIAETTSASAQKSAKPAKAKKAAAPKKTTTKKGTK